MKTEEIHIKNDDSLLVLFWKALALSIIFSAIFGIIIYIATPNYQQDVATGDYIHIDKVIAGQAEIHTILDSDLRTAVNACRQNLKNKNLESIEKSLVTLHKKCEEKCHYNPNASSWSPLSGPTHGGANLCYPGCSDEVKQAGKHLENIIKGGWLEAKSFSKYMALYQNPGYTIWQKILFCIFFSFLSALLFLSVKKIIKNKINERENRVVQHAEAVFMQAKSKESYRRVPIPEDISAKSIKVALDHKMIPENEERCVLEAVSIIENRSSKCEK
jgi:hypothetical protein